MGGRRMRRGYLVYGLAVLAAWTLSCWRGFELFGATRGHLPQNVRQSPGGYRSYNNWGGGK